MAIGTYVLSRANHNAKAAFLQRLDSMATNKGKIIYFLLKVLT